MVLNWGSAVVLPEVFLKALTDRAQPRAAAGPTHFLAADFDMQRHYRPRRERGAAADPGGRRGLPAHRAPRDDAAAAGVGGAGGVGGEEQAIRRAVEQAAAVIPSAARDLLTVSLSAQVPRCARLRLTAAYIAGRPAIISRTRAAVSGAISFSTR